MRGMMIGVVMAGLLCAPVAQAAEDERHAAHHPAADADRPDAGSDEAGMGRKHEEMQELMGKMHEQMKRIRATGNPQERRKLMQEHMQSMHEGMSVMGGMRGRTKGADRMAGTEKGDGESMMEEGGKGRKGMMGGMIMKRHMQMESRMDMLEMMLEQMIEHEKAEQEIESKP